MCLMFPFMILKCNVYFIWLIEVTFNHNYMLLSKKENYLHFRDVHLTNKFFQDYKI